MLVTLDFETAWASDFSLSRMTTTEYVLSPRFQPILVGIKLDDQPSRWYADDDIDKVFNTIDWARTAMLAHHARFDASILFWRYGKRPAFYLDTMGMGQARLFATTGSAALDTLARHAGVGVKGVEVSNFKDYRREHFSDAQLAQYGAYCCNDVDITYRLWQLLKPAMPASELHLIDSLIRTFTEPVLSLNHDTLRAHLAAVQTHQANLLASLGLTPEDCRSDARFAALLEAVGVEPPMKISPTTGQATWAFAKTDEEFTALADDDDPTIQALVAARLGTKTTIEESRTQRLLDAASIVWPDGSWGRLPVPLKYYGAHTGRLSGTDKINLQNIGRKSPLRSCIEAPSGYTLVSADASQIEARVLAWLAAQGDLVQSFANGEDVYAQFASKVYGTVVTKQTHPGERQVGKTGVLGCGYGCGGPRFQGMLRVNKVPMSLEDATGVVHTYRGTYANIADLWKYFNNVLQKMLHMQPGQWEVLMPFPHWAGLNMVVTRESIQLPNGMHLQYRDLRQDASGELSYQYGRWRKKIYGAKLVENIVQALARIVVLDKVTVLRQQAPEARFALTIHDSLIYAVLDDQAATFYGLLLAEMARPPAWGSGIPLAAEGGYGKTLKEAEGK